MPPRWNRFQAPARCIARPFQSMRSCVMCEILDDILPVAEAEQTKVILGPGAASPMNHCQARHEEVVAGQRHQGKSFPSVARLIRLSCDREKTDELSLLVL